MCGAFTRTLVTWPWRRLGMTYCCALRLWSQMCVTCRSCWFPDLFALSCCAGAGWLAPEGWRHTYRFIWSISLRFECGLCGCCEMLVLRVFAVLHVLSIMTQFPSNRCRAVLWTRYCSSYTPRSLFPFWRISWLSVAGCGWLQLWGPHWATSVNYCK